MTTTTPIYCVSGGNSGIGYEVARQLAKTATNPSRLVLLGRDAAKGAACATELQALSPNSTIEFHPCDLSTLQGCRAISDALLKSLPVLDALVVCQGTLTLENKRTADDVALVSAVNTVSKFLLPTLLLPLLTRSSSPRLVFLVAGVPLSSTKIVFGEANFPLYRPRWPGFAAMGPTQKAVFHIAAHFASTQPALRVALCNVGLVKTGILRDMPWVRSHALDSHASQVVRGLFAVVAPLVTVSSTTSASTPVQLILQAAEASSDLVYYPAPGQPNKRQALTPALLPPGEGQQVIQSLRDLCHV